jgi:hypothetical protein
MDKNLVVKNLDGEDLTIDVFDIIEDSKTGKEFICYNIEGDDSTFISSLLRNDSGYSLAEVTDEEKNAIEEVINKNMAEGKYE